MGIFSRRDRGYDDGYDQNYDQAYGRGHVHDQGRGFNQGPGNYNNATNNRDDLGTNNGPGHGFSHDRGYENRSAGDGIAATNLPGQGHDHTLGHHNTTTNRDSAATTHVPGQGQDFGHDRGFSHNKVIDDQGRGYQHDRGFGHHNTGATNRDSYPMNDGPGRGYGRDHGYDQGRGYDRHHTGNTNTGGRRGLFGFGGRRRRNTGNYNRNGIATTNGQGNRLSRGRDHGHGHGHSHKEKRPLFDMESGNFNRRPSFGQWLKMTWLDILTMACMGAVGLGIYEAHPAPSRSFPVTFSDGQIVYPQFAYPLRTEIVPIWEAALLGSLVPIAAILICQIRIRSFWDTNNAIIGLLYSLIAAAVFQVFIKWLIGGLRPHFLSVCDPDPALLLTGGKGFDSIMFQRNICRGNVDQIDDSLESMPSGHTTAAFGGFIYLYLYLNAKLKVFSNHHPAMWKLIVLYAPVLGACLIGGALTIDEYHNWYDVLAGAVIGTVMAFSAYRMVYASVWDFRFNHIPLTRHTPFSYGAGEAGAGGFETAVFTHAGGWGYEEAFGGAPFDAAHGLRGQVNGFNTGVHTNGVGGQQNGMPHKEGDIEHNAAHKAGMRNKEGYVDRNTGHHAGGLHRDKDNDHNAGLITGVHDRDRTADRDAGYTTGAQDRGRGIEHNTGHHTGVHHGGVGTGSTTGVGATSAADGTSGMRTTTGMDRTSGLDRTTGTGTGAGTGAGTGTGTATGVAPSTTPERDARYHSHSRSIERKAVAGNTNTGARASGEW